MMKKAFQIKAFLFFLLLYFLLSLSFPPQITQDKLSYFHWYLIARDDFFTINSPDKGFSLLLSLFPRGLSINSFWMILTSIVQLVFLSLAKLIYDSINNNDINLFLIIAIILIDRIYIDLCFNGIRGSLSIMVFVLAALQEKRTLKYLLFMIAFSIHAYIASFSILFYLFINFFKKKELLPVFLMFLIGFLAVYFIAFSTLMYFNKSIFASPTLKDMVPQRIFRALIVTKNQISFSLAFQIIAGIIIPYIMFLSGLLNKKINLLCMSLNKVKPKIFNLIIFIYLLTPILLFLYLLLPLSMRFFILPIILLPFLLNKNQFFLLFIIKLSLLIFFLYKLFFLKAI